MEQACNNFLEVVVTATCFSTGSGKEKRGAQGHNNQLHQRHSSVKACIDALPQDDIYTSVVTLGEIMKGIEKTTDNERKAKISTWFEEKIVNVDSDVMIEWGKLVVRHKQTLPAMDSLLAGYMLDASFYVISPQCQGFYPYYWYWYH